MLPPEWILQRPTEDFGIDATVAIGDRNNVTPFEFGVQIKSCRKWKTDSEYLLVYDISIDVARYWAFRFVPTLLVAYEAVTQRGFYAWIPDILSESALRSTAKTITLRIPKVNRVADQAWLLIEQRLLQFHAHFSRAVAQQAGRDRLIISIAKLSKSLHLLNMSVTLPSDSEYGKMSYQLAQAVAHKNVVIALTSLVDYLGPHDSLAETLSHIASDYRANCSKVFHPFEALLIADKTIAIWMNEDEAKQVLPRLAATVAECVSELSNILAHSTKGSNNGMQSDALLKNAAATTGEVVLMRVEGRHIQPRHRGEAEETYRPIIRFTTREGRQVQYESIVTSYPPRYSEGDRVRILYDPERSEWARIDDFADLWLRPVFLAGTGSILAVLGAASLHTRYKYGWGRTKQGYFHARR